MALDELKLYLKVENYDDDTLIQSLQLAGETYLTNAGIPKDYTNELYKMAIRLLVTHWYDNRFIDSDKKSVSKMSFSLDTMINSLKYNQVEL